MRKAVASVAVAAGLLIASSSSSDAKNTAVVTVGDPGSRNVSFDFQPSGLTIETRQVGNPGAKLTIWIDSSRSPLFSRLLTEDDCRYTDKGAACTVRFGAGTKEHKLFVASFRRGATAHVEVQNASVMEMRDDVSLRGFRRRYGR